MKIGAEELILIGIILLILFGGKKLPELVKGFTDSIREIKKSSKN